MGGLGQEHLTVDLIGADISLMWLQTVAGDQLSEGLKEMALKWVTMFRTLMTQSHHRRQQ